MAVKRVVPQLRTTDMGSSIEFYTEKLGFAVEFNYQDFYVGIRGGDSMIHLKHVDDKDPSISFVKDGGHLHLYLETADVKDFAEQLKTKGVRLLTEVHETPWQTREFVIEDDQGHTLYFGQPLETR